MTAKVGEKTIDNYGSAPHRHTVPVEASQNISKGWLVARNSSGYLVEGVVSTSLVAVGASLQAADNSAGAQGAIECEVEEGVFGFLHSGDITADDVGAPCYIVDNQTVSSSSNGSTRSIAGQIVHLDSATECRVHVSPAMSKAMKAAAAAASAIQATYVEKTVLFSDLTGADTEVNFASALPANAFILGASKIINTAFSGGTLSAIKGELGINGGDEDCFFDAADIFTGATSAHVGNGVQPTGYVGAVTPTVHINGLVGDTYGNVSAGSATFRLYYCVPA
jgi:hypothetical protein